VLRRTPLVSVVKTADLRELDHPALLRGMHGTGLRRIFVQRQVRPGSIKVAQEAPNDPSQVSFAEHDDVIEALPAEGPDYSLHIRGLPWTSRRSDNFLDVEGLHLVSKQQPINSVPIADQVARRFSVVERLNHLPCDPGGGWMLRHVEVHYPAAIMCQNDQNEQDAKGGRGGRIAEMSAFLRRSPAVTAGPTSDLGRYVNCPRLLQSSQTRIIQRYRVESGNLLIAPPCGRSAHSVWGACSRDLQFVYIALLRHAGRNISNCPSVELSRIFVRAFRSGVPMSVPGSASGDQVWQI